MPVGFPSVYLSGESLGINTIAEDREDCEVSVEACQESESFPFFFMLVFQALCFSLETHTFSVSFGLKIAFYVVNFCLV